MYIINTALLRKVTFIESIPRSIGIVSVHTILDALLCESLKSPWGDDF